MKPYLVRSITSLETVDPWEDAEYPVIASFLDRSILDSLDSPAAVSADALEQSLAALERRPDADEAMLHLLAARIRFQGTDGMRGRIGPNPEGSPVEHFVLNGILSPAFLDIACNAFARLLLDLNVVTEGQRVVVGEDGRDKCQFGELMTAIQTGLFRVGMSVLDMGVCPTPEVPFVMLKQGLRAGIMLTASHNPADQNGIKMFVDGGKLLPEDVYGDYALSAYMVSLDRTITAVAVDGDVEPTPENIHRAFADFIADQLPAGFGDRLVNRLIVVDAANGAYSEIAPLVLDRIGLSYEMINNIQSDGAINRNCGVGELEGEIEFSPEQVTDATAGHIRTLFKRGRKRGEDVFGISLDGDGDRGYLLIYNRNTDTVQIADGDMSAYVTARYLKTLYPDRRVFMNTVESDLMTAYHVDKVLGLEPRIMCVGDKWMSRSDDPSMLIGEEVSGHIIIPCMVGDKQLNTGNGLLSGLLLLAAQSELHMPVDELANPFLRGVSRTWHTYFTNRAMLYPGSPVWEADRDILQNGMDGLIRSGLLPEGTSYAFESRAEEPDMLFCVISDPAGTAIGIIFVRNSGTEKKTGVYLRTDLELEPELEPICKDLVDNHRRMLKDDNSIEVHLERHLSTILSLGAVSHSELRRAIGSALGKDYAEHLDAVLYGMQKEGLVSVSPARVALINS